MFGVQLNADLLSWLVAAYFVYSVLAAGLTVFAYLRWG